MSRHLGRRMTRVEDDRLVRGRGRFTADLHEDGEATMVVVRAIAVGRIARLDAESARKLPGVLAVLTAEDAERDGLGRFGPRLRPPRPDGGDLWVPPFPPLLGDVARHVGQPLAVVVAETAHQAEDAAEHVEVDITPADAVSDPAAAVADGAPAVWQEVPGNVSFLFSAGDRQAVNDAFARAVHVVEQRLVISRVTAAPLETRNVLASYDGSSTRFTLRLGTQTPNRLAAGLAAVLGVAPGAIRVLSGDCGGSFGMKNTPYPEYALALWAAWKLDRPVRWSASRTEAFLADSQGREQVSDAALALDGNGRFLALRVTTLANLGAYLGPMTTHPPVGNLGGLAGFYRTPSIAVEVRGIHTNTQNVAPYRGAGRPEATYVIERMVDAAAAELGLDRGEIRRRNLIRPEEMPFRTGLTFTYDCGNFPQVMAAALEAADWQGFEARRRGSTERGRLRGIGIANAIEIAAGPQREPFPEFAGLELQPDGRVVARVGSGDTGQGHATAFSQLLAERLGADPDKIEVRAGDTALMPDGVGTFGSRSMAAGGTAVAAVAARAVEALKEDAAEALEASAADLEFRDGRFTVRGTDRSVDLGEVLGRRDTPVVVDAVERADDATFPNGCHVCEVEIDPETGSLDVLRYVVADDVGTVVNPLLVEGQIHGGVAQGLGQAIGERVVHAPGSGQPLTASFMDYTMPRADNLPSFEVLSCPTPTRANPLGVKGVGEAGTVGALAVGISAVADALAPLGIRHLDMPATSERIWTAIRNARDRGEA